MEDVKDQTVEIQETVTPEENKEHEVEHVLNSVSDEYLNKKKRTRTITYSALLSVILALATIIIILSSIRVDLKPKFISDPSSYSIYISGTEKMYIDEGSEEYEEFYKAYKDSFNISYLSALFTGKLGAYKIEESTNQFYSNGTAKTGMSNILKTALGNNYVKLSYATEQQVKKANGDIYYSIYHSTEYDLKYEDVYFTLNTENKDSNLTFYFGTTGTGSGYTITKISVRANTYALYDFVTENN